MYAPNNTAEKYMKTKLIELRGLVGTVTIIVGNFNILLSMLSEQSDRKSSV